MKQLHFRLPDKLAISMKVAAVKHGVSLQSVYTQLAEDMLGWDAQHRSQFYRRLQAKASGRPLEFNTTAGTE